MIKTLLVMKLTILLLTVFMLNASANGLAQTITFSGKDVPVQKVFDAIEQQTGYMVFGKSSLLKGLKPVSLTVYDMPLVSFLEMTLKGQPVDFNIEGKNILLSQKESTIIRSADNSRTDFNKLLNGDPIDVKGVIVGPDKIPMQGVSIKITPGNKGTSTNSDGSFVLPGVEPGTYTLEISAVSFETIKRKIIVKQGASLQLGTIALTLATKAMEDVVIVNTGYQKIKANEMVGSAEVISKELLNVNTGMSILDRLKGLTPSLSFNRLRGNIGSSNNSLGITIRGLSTIDGPADPLIVLDEFIYTGNINDINPNTIESVTILKDAVATSIWGMRAANGVIVLTSTKGSKPFISFSSNTTFTEIPRLEKYPSADSRTYIGLVQEQANTGNLSFPNPRRPYQTSDPLVKIFLDRRNNKITAEDSIRLVNELADVDYRDEYKRAFYQTGLRQNLVLSVGQSSGFNNFLLSATYTKDKGITKTEDHRLGFELSNRMRLSSKLSIDQSLSYSSSGRKTGAPAFRSVSTTVNYRPSPYLKFYDKDGSPYGYGYDFEKKYLDTAGGGLLMDWLYYPAEDYKHNYTKSNNSQLRLGIDLGYTINSHLNFHLNYNYQAYNDKFRDVADIDSYEARNIINGASQLDRVAGTISYPIPIGGIINTRAELNKSHTARAILNYSWKFNKHQIHGLAIVEGMQLTNEGTEHKDFGVSDDPLYTQMVTNFGVVKHSLSNLSIDLIRNLDNIRPSYKLEQRTLSQLIAFNYWFGDTYKFFASYRQDGANMFGAKTKDKWNPFWSLGATAELQHYLKSKSWLDLLRVRLTLGISGKVDANKTAEAISYAYTTSYNILNQEILQVNNPSLRWEKTKTFNAGIDFGFFKNFITGRADFFVKRSTDLYGPEPFDYTNFGTQFITRNSSKLNGRGYEFTIGLHPYGKDLNVDLSVSFAYYKDKIVYYNADNNSSVLNQPDDIMRVQGVSPTGVYVVQFKGLNNEGIPQYLYKDKLVTDIAPIVTELRDEGVNGGSVKYLGTREPILSTSINPRISYKNLSMIVTMSYYGKHFVQFHNYYNPWSFQMFGDLHESYANRWQKPGDELHTNIQRSTVSKNYTDYTQVSDYAWRRGDNLRINGIQFSWTSTLNKTINYSIGAGVNNIGVIWSKEKDYVYRDFPSFTPANKSYILNLSVTF
jgi:TonB-linked SusC/RagA family outer membrane protein